MKSSGWFWLFFWEYECQVSMFMQKINPYIIALIKLQISTVHGGLWSTKGGVKFVALFNPEYYGFLVKAPGKSWIEFTGP